MEQTCISTEERRRCRSPSSARSIDTASAACSLAEEACCLSLRPCSRCSQALRNSASMVRCRCSAPAQAAARAAPASPGGEAAAPPPAATDAAAMTRHPSLAASRAAWRCSQEPPRSASRCSADLRAASAASSGTRAASARLRAWLAWSRSRCCCSRSLDDSSARSPGRSEEAEAPV